MSSEMIERVCLAIENASECRNCGSLIRGEHRADACCERPDWLEARPELRARAAIEAMREPTEAMLANAGDRVWSFDPDRAPTTRDARGDVEGSAEDVGRLVWLDMIDVALS